MKEVGSTRWSVLALACAALFAVVVSWVLVPERMSVLDEGAVRSAERFATWWSEGGRELRIAAWEGQPRIAVGAPLLAGALSPSNPWLGLRVVASLGAVLLVISAWLFGFRAGGAFVAGTSAWLAAAMPLVFDAGARAGASTLGAGAVMVVFAWVPWARRTNAGGLGLAVLVALALWASPIGWYALLPLLFALAIRGGAGTRGRWGFAPMSPMAAVSVPIGVLLHVALDPYFRAKTPERIGQWLLDGLRRPAMPWLTDGLRSSDVRPHAWSGLTEVLTVTPGVLGVLALSVAVIAWVGRGTSERDRASWRGVRPVGLVLLAACALPVVLRSRWHAGTDLIVHAVPLVATLAAIGVTRAMDAARAARPGVLGAAGMRVAVVGLVVSASVVEWLPFRRAPDAFVSTVAGGVATRVERGRARCGDCAVPVDLFRDLPGERRVHAPVDPGAWRPVLERIGRLPSSGGPIAWSGVSGADAWLWVYDDASPDFWTTVVDAELARREGPPGVRSVTAGGVPVFVLAPARR